jgi:hypothetical protein
MKSLSIKLLVALITCATSTEAFCVETLADSYKEANIAFEKLAQESNTMGMIKYCHLQDQFPKVNETIKQRIIASFDESIPKEDRLTRITLLFSMINMYAGGVAQGLSISHVLNNKNGPDKEFCSLAAGTAREIFPTQKPTN